ncbi:MAG: hypothetical protein J2O47_08585, partial [Acidimicrobiaceae bacterium]|nr:hypothetical protein [Acidimicrobiaceae bacterium]
MALATTQSDPVENRRKLPIPPRAEDSPKPVRRWRAFALLVVAYFMTIVDLTIVNVALPTIGKELSFPES